MNYCVFYLQMMKSEQPFFERHNSEESRGLFRVFLWFYGLAYLIINIF